MRRSPLAVALLGLALLAACDSQEARDARAALARRGIEYAPERFLAEVKRGDLETVDLFLAAGMSSATRDAETHTALMWAAELGHENVAAALIAAGAPLEARVARKHWIEIPFMTERREHAGRTALMFALGARHGRVARRLIAAGASLDDLDPGGSWSMPALACLARDPETLRAMLERGAAVDRRDNTGGSALLVAAANGDAESAKLLIAHGASVDFRSPGRGTPLIAAVQSGSAEVVRLLLEAGADPGFTDHYGRTALIYAEHAQRADIAALLRAHGSRDGELLDDQLLEALYRRDLAAAHELLSRGANPNARFQNRLGDEPAIVLAARLETSEGVAALLGAGADPRATGSLGDTALHAAAHAGAADSIRLLIRAGVPPDARDRNQWTPLLQAAHSGRAEAVRALLEGGARVDEPAHDGATPLMIAARGGDVMAREPMNAAAAEQLLAAHADRNAADERGSTALHHAVQRDRLQMLELLLRAGADPNAANRAGETPLSLAVARSSAEAERLLRAAGATR